MAAKEDVVKDDVGPQALLAALPCRFGSKLFTELREHATASELKVGSSATGGCLLGSSMNPSCFVSPLGCQRDAARFLNHACIQDLKRRSIRMVASAPPEQGQSQGLGKQSCPTRYTHSWCWFCGVLQLWAQRGQELGLQGRWRRPMA